MSPSARSSAFARRSKATPPCPPHERPTPSAVNLGWLGTTIGYNLQLTQSASFQAFSALTGDAGLRPGRYALMQLIADNPGISQTALSQAVGRDKSTLTPLLADLARRRLLNRMPDPADGRGLKLALTKAGLAMLGVLAACARQHEERLDTVLGPELRQQLIDALRLLAADLARQTGPLSPTADEV